MPFCGSLVIKEPLSVERTGGRVQLMPFCGSLVIKVPLSIERVESN